MKILGTPIGSDAFVQAKEERRLWEATPWVPDVQCGWQILLQCAGPRCQHFLRTVPPSQSARYAQSHDTGMRHAMEAVLGGVPRSSEQKSTAHKIKSLPMRLGGLGLRSAERMKPVAFWASSADALPMQSNRLPTLTDQVENELETGVGGTPCMLELSAATHTLDRSGFVDRPGWHQLRMGARPPLVASSEPGEWQHGWQFHASSPLEHHFLETVILAKSCVADQAHLRSHAGAGASDVLHGTLTGLEFKMEPHLFRTLVLERLRLPLPVTEAFFECGCPGCVGQTQGCLPKVRSVAGQGCRSGTVPGPCLQRSRCHY